MRRTPQARDISEARAAWNEWDRLVKSSREDWIKEAQSEKLPKVEIVDFRLCGGD